MLGVASVCLAVTELFPLVLGAVMTPLVFGIALCLFGIVVGDLAVRILQPRVDAQLCAEEAMKGNNSGAALIYLGRCILQAVIILLVVTSARAASPPPAALQYLPLLQAQHQKFWPELTQPSLLGAQVEQETCITLTHRSCWSPRAELRTKREQGVGFGQMTRAFNAWGATRFDTLADLVRAYPTHLKGLTWDNPYDPELQLRALVLKDLQVWHSVLDADTPNDRLAMTFSAYNGGQGGLMQDRKACSGTKGCNSAKWFGHVANTSLKAKAAVPGYGKSFFAINREYVTNIMHVREPRYRSLNPA
jgi:hypothetical protein